MLYNLGQIKTQLAQLCGVKDENGDYAFSDTTSPTNTLANNIINDSIREVTSSYDYTFLETSKSYPWVHTISGVQGISLSGVSVSLPHHGTTGQIIPYPSSVLNYSWTANNSIQDIANNFSGISFSGVDSLGNNYASVSVSGTVITGDWSGIGYTYPLDQDVDKIIAVMLSQSIGQSTPIGIKMTEIDWNHMERLIPIGNITASGTPIYYSEMPGLSPTNNKTLQFFPFPLPMFSGQNFIVHYKKRHVDLETDEQTQNVVPESYQNLIIQASLEKIFDFLDSSKAQLATERKNDLISKMRLWDAQQPNKMPQWEDFTYNSNSGRLYDNSTVVYLPYNN